MNIKHKRDDLCRQAESYFPGDGFIAYKDGIYIKPLENNDTKKKTTTKNRSTTRIRTASSKAPKGVRFNIIVILKHWPGEGNQMNGETKTNYGTLIFVSIVISGI